MGTPISFNSGTTSTYVTGVFKRASIGLNLATALAANTNWWNGVDVSNSQYLIYSDIYSQGQSSFSTSRPTAWTTPDLNDSSLILLINTLPDRVGLPGFTTISQAVNWLNQTGKYFLLKLGYDNIVTSNIKLRMDAGWFNSYPGSGSVWTDLSANAYSATLYNGPVFVGVDNGVLDFDGANDYGSFGTAIVPAGSSPYTVIVWVKRGRNNVGYEEVLAQWTFAGSGNSFYLGFDSGNVRFTDSWSTITGVYGAEKVNEWMCLVGVNTGSNAYIYLNGVLMATKGSALTYSATGPLVIGRQGELNGEYFDGQIGLIQVYDVALNSTQILQNFNAQAYRYGLNNAVVTSGLLLYLDASNPQSYPGTGTVWYDLSGNNAHANMVGTPTWNSNGYFTFDSVSDGFDGVNVPQDYVDLHIEMYSDGSNGTGLEMVVAKYDDADKSFRTANGVFRHENNGGDANDWNYENTQYDYVDGNFITSNYNLTGNWHFVRLARTNTTFNPPFIYSLSSNFLSRGYLGKIKKVLMYDRILGSSEVKQNFYQGNIVQSGISLLLDAANPVSYPTTGTSWKDLTGNGNNGTLTNGPTFSTSNGGAIVFDGTDDYVVISSSADLAPGAGDFTYSSWIYPNSYSTYAGLLVVEVTGGLWIGKVENNFVLRAYAVANFLEYSTLPTTSQWTNVVITRSGSSVTLYYNGVSVATASTSYNFLQAAAYIGNDGSTPSANFNGRIASTLFYKGTALNSLQVQQNFNAYKSRYGL